jgi:uncharacterized protein YbjQ (UPF0145 family)
LFVTTTDTVPGHQIVKWLSLAVGTVAVSTNKFEAGMKRLETGEDVDRDRALLRARWEAVDQMTEYAAGWRANAVVGVRFEHRAVTAAWSEVCAYGTAVLIQPYVG